MLHFIIPFYAGNGNRRNAGIERMAFYNREKLYYNTIA